MALEGSLKEFGLADILQLIYFQRKTGILSLSGRLDKIRLFFYEGNIVAAESKRRTESNRIGKVLVKKGFIKEEDLQKALAEQQATGLKLGNILIGGGLVEREQIKEMISAQITETVIQLFGWKEGLYEFSPQGVPVDKEIPVSLDTQHLLMEGLRIIDEWSLIEGKLTLDTVFKRTGKKNIDLSPEEEEIIMFVDGENDVSTIIDVSHWDSFNASKTLVSLMEKGAIEPRESISVAVTAPFPEVGLPARKGLSFYAFVTTTIFIVSLFIAVIPLSANRSNDIRRLKAYEDIDAIRFELEVYKYKNGSYPDAIENIMHMTDRWGRPYIYRKEINGIVLFSAGPDGKEGTEDDIY